MFKGYKCVKFGTKMSVNSQTNHIFNNMGQLDSKFIDMILSVRPLTEAIYKRMGRWVAGKKYILGSAIPNRNCVVIWCLIWWHI